MGKMKDINIKNRNHDDTVNIKDFDSNLLKIDSKKKSKSHSKTLLFITLDISQRKINTKLIV